jgi:hypothetical protein
VIAAARAVGVTAALTYGLLACNESFHFDVRSTDGGGNDAGDGGDGTDGGCSQDTMCGGLECDVASGSCVDCLSDDDCTVKGLPRCEPTNHICVACLNGPDCAKRQKCDTVTNRCLDSCFDADDACPVDGFSCSADLGLCIECASSTSCAGSPNGSHCDIPIGRCVQCTGNAECPSATPFCDRRTGTCQACILSTACSAGSVCDPTTLTCRSAS